MEKKEIFLCATAFLLSCTICFAADEVTTGQGGASTTTKTSNGNTTSMPPSSNAADSGSTGGTVTNSNTGSLKDSGSSVSKDSSSTPSTDSQGIKSNTSTNSNDFTQRNNHQNLNTNVTEVNNKVVIQGVSTAPHFTNVEFRDNVYYLPPAVTLVRGFYFLNIHSTERVCTLKKIRKVKVLTTPTSITVIKGNKKRVVYCYDRSYFSF
ncbi:MAG: hypothetical protein H0U75_06120 [Legionella sp.]|nr:hypothetical protein [Legionella sp.]